MFASRCATLLMLGGLVAACADTTSVVAPLDAPPPGPSFSVFAIPDAGYLAQTTKIDISGFAIGQSVTSITDGTQTVSFDPTLAKGFSPVWGVPPAVESPQVDVLLSSFPTGVAVLTLSRPTTTFGFEAMPLIVPGPNVAMTAEFYSPSGVLLETSIQSHSTVAGRLYAAGSVGLIGRVLIHPPLFVGVAIAQVRYGELLDVAATVDASVTVNPKTGVAVVTGTMACNLPATVPISVSLQQQQKAKRVQVLVQASGTTSVACTGTSVWSMALAPSSGGFVNGKASASLTAGVGLIDPPIAVTKDVKLYWGHK